MIVNSIYNINDLLAPATESTAYDSYLPPKKLLKMLCKFIITKIQIPTTPHFFHELTVLFLLHKKYVNKKTSEEELQKRKIKTK